VKLATMLTMTSGSRPDIGIDSYDREFYDCESFYREKSERGAPK
jgi:hypothetical protein